ncbi:hypothetical protein PanWU01x14_049690 [Parasponia andersonii]|uniref:Uncharacterized protein n=1 Tax=Parasponia andersonii TaxID=3476 RepID=A0A2P5DMN6_PARAD|nr:hypothetical protein PanWU01x14_049690 [Parasponia andersonii]
MPPPGFAQQALPPQQEKKPSLEEMFMQYMAKNDVILQNQAAILRSFETQLGQLANADNNRPQGTLPGNTEVNPNRENKEQFKVITLRSGKEVGTCWD